VNRVGSGLRPEMGVRRGLGLITRGCFFDRVVDFEGFEEEEVEEALRLRPPVEVVVSSPDSSLDASLNSDSSSSSSSSVIFEDLPFFTTFLLTLGGGGRTVIDLREERRGAEVVEVVLD